MKPISGKQATIHVFGTKLDGIDYIDRPGVYAVIENNDQRIAVIETSNGYFLPGGGIDPGETEVAALKREMMEEIGYQVTVLAEIGEAIDYMEAAKEEKYYQIRSRFYKVQMDSKIGGGVEKDHRLVWLSQEDASKRLVRQSQVWAIQSIGRE